MTEPAPEGEVRSSGVGCVGVDVAGRKVSGRMRAKARGGRGSGRGGADGPSLAEPLRVSTLSLSLLQRTLILHN